MVGEPLQNAAPTGLALCRRRTSTEIPSLRDSRSNLDRGSFTRGTKGFDFRGLGLQQKTRLLFLKLTPMEHLKTCPIYTATMITTTNPVKVYQSCLKRLSRQLFFTKLWTIFRGIHILKKLRKHPSKNPRWGCPLRQTSFFFRERGSGKESAEKYTTV